MINGKINTKSLVLLLIGYVLYFTFLINLLYDPFALYWFFSIIPFYLCIKEKNRIVKYASYSGIVLWGIRLIFLISLYLLISEGFFQLKGINVFNNKFFRIMMGPDAKVIETPIVEKVSRVRADIRTLRADINDKKIKDIYSTNIQDPFSNKKLAIIKEENQFILYSHGPDYIDNKATIVYDPTNGTISSGDIIFSINEEGF